MKLYRNVSVCRDNDALEVLGIMDIDGVHACIAWLSDADDGTGDTSACEPWCDEDLVFHDRDGYVLVANRHRLYVSLTKIVRGGRP